MTEIEGNVQAVIMDVLMGTMGVLMNLAMGEYGPIEEETSTELAKALGGTLADIQNKASEGVYS